MPVAEAWEWQKELTQKPMNACKVESPSRSNHSHQNEISLVKIHEELELTALHILSPFLSHTTCILVSPENTH